jgi:hypothetical protein
MVGNIVNVSHYLIRAIDASSRVPYSIPDFFTVSLVLAKGINMSPYERLVNMAIAHLHQEGWTEITRIDATISSSPNQTRPDLKGRCGSQLALIKIATTDDLNAMCSQTMDQWRNLYCSADVMDGCLVIAVSHDDCAKGEVLLHAISSGADNAWILLLSV